MEGTFYETGIFIYDPPSDRTDIRFEPESYHGGLHCRTGMDVLINSNCSVKINMLQIPLRMYSESNS